MAPSSSFAWGSTSFNTDQNQFGSDVKDRVCNFLHHLSGFINEFADDLFDILQMPACGAGRIIGRQRQGAR
jgi:hypothetical protein